MSMHLIPSGREALGVSPECASNWRYQLCREGGGSEADCELQECATGERIPVEVIEAGDRADYPWMQKAPLTCTLQANINSYLEDEGYMPITEDCVLGAETCGAARAMTFAYEPETCQAWTDPILKSEAPPPPAPPPAPEPPPVTVAPPPKRGLSKASMWAIGGVVAAVVIGGGYYLTKKAA